MKDKQTQSPEKGAQSYSMFWALALAIGIAVVPAFAQEAGNGKKCQQITDTPTQDFDTCTGPKPNNGAGPCNGTCLTTVDSGGSCGKCVTGDSADNCGPGSPISTTAQVGTCGNASSTTCRCTYTPGDAKQNVMIPCDCN